jgi:hypothetical protein
MGPFEKPQDYDAERVVEKHPSANGSSEFVPDEGAIHAETFIIGDSLYAKVHRFAGRFGVENRGIERVPSDERTDIGMSKIGTMVCLIFDSHLIFLDKLCYPK